MPGTSGASNTELFNIELRLKTNFAKVLTQNAVHFESFSRNATSVTRSISKSMDTFAQTVGSSMSVVAKNTQKEFQNLVDFTRSSFRTLSVQSDTIARKIADTYAKIAERKRAAEAAISVQRGLTAKRKADLPLTEKTEDIKKALDEQLKGTIASINKRLDADLNAIVKTAQGKIGTMLVRQLTGAIKTLERQSADSVAVVDKTITAMSNRYKQLQSQMGTMRGVEQLGMTKAHYEEMIGQEKVLYQHQEQYRQRSKEAEIRLNQAITIAKRRLYGELENLANVHNSKLLRETYDRFMKSGDTKWIGGIKKQFGEAWDQLPEEIHNSLMRVDAMVKKDLQPLLLEAYQSARNIGKGFKEAGDKAEQFSQDVRKMGDTLRKQTQAWRAGFADMRKMSTVSQMFNQLWKNLEEQAGLAGDRSSKAFKDSFSKGKQLGSALDAYKVKVQQTIKDIQYASQRGLIDKDTAYRDVTRLNEIIAKIKEFQKVYAQVVKERASVGSFLGFSQRKVDLTGLAKIRSEMTKVQKDMPSAGGVTEENIAEYVSGFRKLEQLTTQWYNKKKQLNKQLEGLEVELQRVISEQKNLIDAKAKAHYAEYESRLRVHIKKIKAAITKMSQNMPQIDILKATRLTESQVSQIQANIRKAFVPAPDIEQGIKKLKQRYEDLVVQAGIIEKKTFFRKGMIIEASAALKKLQAEFQAYREHLDSINKLLRRTAELQKLGFQSTQLKNLRRELEASKGAIRSHLQELNTLSTKTQTRIDNLNKQAVSGGVRRSWEMIRNFRWQVAAVIYLVQRALWFFGRTLGQLFNNVQEYRKSAMSIAASIAFQMVDDIKVAYDKAYAYSRNLMLRLEMTAAKTILTMEDMLMLTKTLTQAGFIPNIKEDVDKIATIGVAIKALTEGMANAGVQMRQELYAVIQGRQRATDQLAKMLELQGVNIKRIMEEARESGADFIDVLSKKLEPFAEMNRRMAGEWETVKNKMGVVFKVIQRIAAESLLVDLAKRMDEVVSKFYNMDLGKLTAQGNTVAGILRGVLLIIGRIAEIIVQMVKFFATMVNQLMQIPLALMKVFGITRDTKSEWAGVLLLLEGVTYGLQAIVAFLNTIVSVVKTIVTGVKFLLRELVAAGKILYGMGTGDFSMIKEGLSDAAKVAKESWNEVKETWKDWFNTSIMGFANIKKEWNDVYQKIEDSNKALEEVDLGKLFKLPRSLAHMQQQFETWGPKISKAKVEGLESFEKIKAEREEALKNVDIMQEDLRVNIESIDLLLAQHALGVVKIGQQKMEALLTILNQHKEMAEEVQQFIAYINRKAALENKKETERLAEQAAQQKRQFEQFKESISITREATREEKTNKWLADMEARLNELTVKNPLVKKNFKELRDILYETFGERQQEDIRNTKKEIEDMMNKIGTKSIKTIYEEADLEAKKLNDEIKAMINLSDTEKLKLHEMVIEMQSYKKEVEKTNAAWEAQLKYFDSINDKIDALSGSYSPIKQQQAEILRLQNDYNRRVAELRKEQNKVTLGFRDMNGAIDRHKEGAKEALKQYNAIEEQITTLGYVFEREMDKKMNPMWNDFVEASKSWADSFTDALSEITNGVDDMGEAISNLQKQILQDAARMSIKRIVTDPLQDYLGSALAGEESPMQKLFGWAKSSENIMEIKATQPIPVYIVKENFITPLADSMKDNKDSVDKVEQTVADGNGKIVRGLAEVVAANEAQAAASGGGGGGLWDMAKSGWNKLSGLFGASSAVNLGGGQAAGAFALETGAIVNPSGVVFGMAGGGTVSEHVVGRGLESGNLYHFGENAKYGEDEVVAPIKKLRKAVPTEKHTLHMPIYLNAIDTQSGVQFLMQHSDTIQKQMLRGLKNNKPIRRGLRDAY